ncbi:hypothetical protein [uncultured Bradyrhizobium sp.]|uniref:hypothetical protein n=1 Tax=uncultured Bradyrhizobium sp. TaxID=199684 RepID=UPI0035CB0DB7
MAAIEPNWVSLIWFAACATICMIAFLVVAGMFPLRSRPERARSGTATLLVAGNGVLLPALMVSTGFYGYAELKWSSLIIVTGLVVLFAPGLFEAWPPSFRDGPAGLILLVGIQILAIVSLAKVAGPPWAATS